MSSRTSDSTLRENQNRRCNNVCEYHMMYPERAYLIDEKTPPAKCVDKIMPLLRDHRDDLFLDASYIDKMILDNPSATANLIHMYNIGDDGLIFSSLRTLKMLRSQDEQHLIAELKSAASRFRNMGVRVHYTNILHEPIVYRMRSMWTLINNRATQESMRFLTRHVPSAATFKRLMASFFVADDIIRYLNTKFGAGISWFGGTTRMHKIRKSLSKLSPGLREPLLKYVQEQATGYARNYESALRRRDHPRLTKVWLQSFQLLRDMYAVSRVACYMLDNRVGNVVVVDNARVLHLLRTILDANTNAKNVNFSHTTHFDGGQQIRPAMAVGQRYTVQSGKIGHKTTISIRRKRM
jgi:hypothetical protein